MSLRLLSKFFERCLRVLRRIAHYEQNAVAVGFYNCAFGALHLLRLIGLVHLHARLNMLAQTVGHGGSVGLILELHHSDLVRHAVGGIGEEKAVNFIIPQIGYV